MLVFEVTQVLSLGETTFIVARQTAGGPFDVTPGSVLGETSLKPVLDVARSSMTHDEPDEQTFVFTVEDGDTSLPAVGDSLRLTVRNP
jgi:hypothetical protein